ncbi:SulP family inorganic anion transporter [Streptomyces sp. NPDC050619]|uniref:SulP family inorganic anion transporter n=1 Tax=Streptomyces sp. NPDC050619 TaxID=3157214 RepID=UPI00342BE770
MSGAHARGRTRGATTTGGTATVTQAAAPGSRPSGPSGPEKTPVSRPEKGEKVDLGTEITASLVVFLVALPLCIGVAVASGVPAELGIISGVIGGLVVGAVRGSTLQVSGPAAGLAALVAETVAEHGVAMLGVIVLGSGILQIVLGVVRLGRMFQAISLAVVQGMLAGIGLPLMFSQVYPMADGKAPGTPIENMAGIPGLFADILTNRQAMIATLLGIVTVVLSFVWKKVPGPVKKVPAALVAVGIGIGVAALPGVDVKTLQVGNLLASVQVPGGEQFAGLADAAIITSILTFTVIASAESLFTAAAVDRMHSGPRTRYNTELIAQGAGNTVAGVLGALPITAVVARSSANVQAGAKTRLSRTLHGLWLLAFALLLPQVLALIPISVLAGVLVHSGWKLFAPEEFPKMWRQDRGEFVVMTVTTLVIVATALLEGVLIGLAAGIVLAALRMSQTVVKQHLEEDTAKVVMAGNATFLRLPKVIEALEAAAASGKPRIRLDLTGVTHLDHACRNQVEEFTAQQRGKGLRVELLMPGPGKAAETASASVSPEVETAVGPVTAVTERTTSRPGGRTMSKPGGPASAMRGRAAWTTPTEQWAGTTADPTTTTPAEPWSTTTPAEATTASSTPAEPTESPGPDAEWFYLDTRPLPDDYAGRPPLVG